MIKIILNNEALDIDPSTVVTFKKAQQLNGIQGLYSFSNNFGLKDSAKNRRLLGINYLPNSKAKSMTAGYEVDVILNGCIFLKRQKLKVQKESKGSIPVYLIFADNLFVAKAKNTLMSQIDTGVTYVKSLAEFLDRNDEIGASGRTAPISAQDKSGLVVAEEVPILLNIKDLVIRIFEQLGYGFTGDILTDPNIGDYYTSQNVGVYGPDGTPRFDATKTVYDFMLDFLETFNGYIEVSDSSKLIGLYLWKNIEGLKQNFVDYSSKFVSFEDYVFEGGLAKKNTLAYTGSPDYYNGFFDNNKSVVDKTSYLVSNFGAGEFRFFGDQSLDEDGHIELREIGEVSEPKLMNLFRFEDVQTVVPVYANGFATYAPMYKAFSPNILEIWQIFHKPYTDNIALPTIAQLKFRYDAIFLANFKMTEVFFLKQLSTYWLPMELNFTTKKEDVRIKCLMIEKTPVDVPVIFDQSLSVDFYGDVFILDVFALYSAANVSPAATMLITAADLTKNDIFVNGVQVLAFPTSIDVSDSFELKVSNIETENVLSNSDILFQFVSEAGGVSRVGKINVAHNGRASFVSEFRSELDVVFGYGVEDQNDFSRNLNYSGKITTPVNIADTFAPLIGDANDADSIAAFKVLQFDRDSTVKVDLTIGYLWLKASDRNQSGVKAKVTVQFLIRKNGADILQIYSAGVIDAVKVGDAIIELYDVGGSGEFNVLAGDSISISAFFKGTNIPNPFDLNITGGIQLKNVNWKFSVTEQL